MVHCKRKGLSKRQAIVKITNEIHDSYLLDSIKWWMDRSETRILFLSLWDKAVKTKGYNKKEWTRLAQLLGII